MTENTADLTARLAALEARLSLVEDERAIVNLLASYGPLVDSGTAKETSEVWTEDGVYDVADDYVMEGRQAVHDMVLGEGHQGLINNGSAHFNGPPHVVVDGDDARAVCHSLLVLKNADGRFFVARAGSHLFTLVRTEDGWKVKRRTTRLLNGDATARLLLSSGVTGVDLPEGH